MSRATSCLSLTWSPEGRPSRKVLGELAVVARATTCTAALHAVRCLADVGFDSSAGAGPDSSNDAVADTDLSSDADAGADADLSTDSERKNDQSTRR